MSAHASLYVEGHLFAAVLATALAGYAARNRGTPGSRPVAFMLFSAAGWAAGYALLLTTPDFETKLLVTRLTFVPIVFTSLLWFDFSLRYTGVVDAVPSWLLPTFAVVSTGFAVAGVTNPAHQLIWVEFVESSGPFAFSVAEYGPVYGVYLTYSYALLVAGMAVITRQLLVADDVHRGQAWALLVAVATPLLANAVYFLGFTRPGFDPTALAVTVSSGALWFSVFRHHLLSLAPASRDIARDEFIDRMSDPVVALNNRGVVVDANPAACEVFGRERDRVVGHRLVAVAPDLAAAVDRFVPDVTGTQVFRTRTGDATEIFDVSIEPLDWHGDDAGRLVSLHNVTDRRQREEQLRVLHRLLRHNLRNDLNVIAGHAHEADAAAAPGPVRGHTAVIERRARRLVDQADKLGRVINDVDVDGEVSRRVDVGDLLADVVREARSTTPPSVTVSLDVGTTATVESGPLLRLALTELIENGVVHNGSVAPTVELSVSDADDRSSVAIRVADDGPGIPDYEVDALRQGEETPLEHTTGVGLWVVVWAVNRYNGRVSFESDGFGTVVTVVLPRIDE